MRTPRPNPARRGLTTLIGNGWLHEPPKVERPAWQQHVDARGRSALRKCMFLPIPPGVQALPPPPVSPAAMPRRVQKHDTPFSPRRRHPEKDVRMFPQISPDDVAARQRIALFAEERAKALGQVRVEPRPWYEDPVALGSLLILVPPVGLAALWSSKRYSSDARWALTVMTALMMCLAAAITIALIILKS